MAKKAAKKAAKKKAKKRRNYSDRSHKAVALPSADAKTLNRKLTELEATGWEVMEISRLNDAVAVAQCGRWED